MGKKGRKRKGGAFGGDRNKRKKTDTDKGGFRAARDPSTLSKDFIEYYKKQNICAEEEWEEMKLVLSKRLPISFRLNSCNPEINTRLIKWLETDYFNLAPVEGSKIEEFTFKKPSCMTWYPNKLAWEVPVPRKCLRKIDGLKPFRKALIFENDHGGLTRQEAVSMIPGVLLDVKPKHKVLDVCAAPGSKTTQILEALHRGKNGEFIPFPSGFVIANDSDTKRSRMLTHQLQRFGSGNFLVMNKFGQCIPKVHYGAMPTLDDPTAGTGKTKDGLLFDRILCDVPCSGDGTLRKSPEMWTNWKVVSGNQIHREQLKITRRAIQLLKPGGLLVYSTCTFNPIENEAVVSQLLRESEGSLVLKDVREKLPGLKSELGMSTWEVLDAKTKAWYTKHEDVPSNRERLHTRSMFPPTKEEVEKMNLQYCLRILPHKQDTGGFFICVLKKPKKAYAQESNDMTEEEMDDEERKCSGSRPPPSNDENAPFYSLVRGDHRKIAVEIKDFFGITDEFAFGQLVCRSPGKTPNHIYLSPNNVARLTTRPENEKLRIVQSGIRAFARQKTKDTTVPVKWRISQAGAPFMMPYVTKQKVKIPLELYERLLKEQSIRMDELSEDLQSDLNQNSNGSLIFELDSSIKDKFHWRFRALAGWKGREKIQVYVSKQIKEYLNWVVPLIKLEGSI